MSFCVEACWFGMIMNHTKPTCFYAKRYLLLRRILYVSVGPVFSSPVFSFLDSSISETQNCLIIWLPPTTHQPFCLRGAATVYHWVWLVVGLLGWTAHSRPWPPPLQKRLGVRCRCPPAHRPHLHLSDQVAFHQRLLLPPPLLPRRRTMLCKWGLLLM